MRIRQVHSWAFTCVLVANALWDFACALSILTHSEPLASMHTGLWLSEAERESAAASHLMAYLVFCWGFLRLLGALVAARGVVLFSYALECAVFASEAALFGTMHYGRGMAVSAASAALAVWAYGGRQRGAD